MGSIFYREAYIICLVYDITNKNSFENIKKIWYPAVKQNGEECTILAVVGNKSDLFDKEKVKEDKAREYAKEINGYFFLTSAKEDVGIDNLFMSVVKKYLDPEFQVRSKSGTIKDLLKERKNFKFNVKSRSYLF